MRKDVVSGERIVRLTKSEIDAIEGHIKTWEKDEGMHLN